MKPPNILLADPDPDSHTIYATIMEHRGFGVLHACDGVEALRIAREQRPDLIVVELFLPLVQGKPLVNLLKQDCRTAAIPVIGLTAVPRFVGLARGLLTCDRHLPKPCIPSRLFREVEQLLGTCGRDAGLSVIAPSMLSGADSR